MKTISRLEKNDILLALALVYEKNYRGVENSPVFTNISELAEKSFNAINADDYVEITSRANYLDELTTENQEIWRENRVDRVRRRGRAILLDGNINPTHLAENLTNEPKHIQNLILQNLPKDLSVRIAFYLKLGLENEAISPNQQRDEKQINPTIIALLKQKFLENFVSYEDIYEPAVIDKFSVVELENFILQLGLREVAIACRGINSKETLAAFLNRFDEDDVRDIAIFLTELQKIRPFWVAQADELVRKTWNKNLPPKKVLKIVGLRLLSMAFSKSEQNAINYNKQKLSIQEARQWQKMVSRNQEILLTENTEERIILERRIKSLDRLANKFAQTAKL